MVRFTRFKLSAAVAAGALLALATAAAPASAGDDTVNLGPVGPAGAHPSQYGR
jgi:hypothetical protein